MLALQQSTATKVPKWPRFIHASAAVRFKVDRQWLPDGYSHILRSYVFGPSGFWTMAPLPMLQNLIPSFPYIAPPRPPPWFNPRKGRDLILPSGNLGIDQDFGAALVTLLKEREISSVTDFGCGTGGYVKMISDAGIYARGFDGNPNTGGHAQMMSALGGDRVLPNKTEGISAFNRESQVTYRDGQTSGLFPSPHFS